MENYISKTSISDKDNFKKICEIFLTDDNQFKNFKSNPIFTEILEHTSFEQGIQYINEIEKDIKIDLNNLTKFKENDIQGNPKKYDYKNPYGNISPSTLRYIKVLNDLILEFGSLENWKIVEIGVGYGGQSKVIRDQFNVNEYNFIDLYEVNNLTKKYLNFFNYDNNNFLDFKNLPDKEYDLVISNYAFTECSLEIQNLYLDKIIKKSKHGYIIGNDIGAHFNIENYNKTQLLSIIDGSVLKEEKPLTHHLNYLLIF